MKSAWKHVLVLGMLVLASSGCCKKRGSSVFDIDGLDAAGMGGPGNGSRSSPRQTPTPLPGVPDGRSAPPTVEEWVDAGYVNTVGAHSAPSRCYMKVVREWLKVNCSGRIYMVTDMHGFGHQGSDYFAWYKENKVADYVVRMRRGTSQKLRIHRPVWRWWERPPDRYAVRIEDRDVAVRLPRRRAGARRHDVVLRLRRPRPLAGPRREATR